jgi:transposase
MDDSDRRELALRELAFIFSDTNLSFLTISECFERHNFDFEETFYELSQPTTDWVIVDPKVPVTQSAAQPAADWKPSADSKSRKALRKAKPRKASRSWRLS